MTVNNTTDVTFVCVVGQGVPAGGSGEVLWNFTNESGLTRRLVSLVITWPTGPTRNLLAVNFGGTTVWNLGTSLSPITINSGWLGTDADRQIIDSATRPLLITFDFVVTGGQQYTVLPAWDDTAGGSVCDSGAVTVTR